LLVFRHGIAERAAADGTDAARSLTAAGRKKTEAAARGLARMVSPPEAILTSPKQRAVQTADAAARVFGVEPEALDALADGSVDGVVSHLAGRTEDSVMIVGHEPMLSGLVETLCVGEVGGFVRLKKAGCALLDVDLSTKPPRASLAWLATPAMLRSLRPTRARAGARLGASRW
jgi:phosphohistidine phosphatase